ncbi:MAG TPA: metalloregulator ArsR/SmtB family transcription factor [Patescibacteria group bacterium]|nr:metalloregulator ArsR/SmtB family transcription factor [Patescibacteria group bacterium]
MADKVVKVLDALSDETRVEIIRDLLAGHKGICPEIKERTGKSQPTLSHHIGKLVDADVLIESKKGVNCYYKVNSKYLKSIGIDIKKITQI